MENCVAPGLDKMWYIIRSCVVFNQSTLKAASNNIARPITDWNYLQRSSFPSKIAEALYPNCLDSIQALSLINVKDILEKKIKWICIFKKLWFYKT